MKNFYLLLILVLGCSLFANAQQNHAAAAAEVRFKISGRVLDSLSGQPIEYATVSLFGAKGSRPLSGAMTDKKGNWEIGGLPAGSYTITIEVIGYAKQRIGSVTVGGNTQITALGNIPMAKQAADLQSVTVVAPRGLVENKIDKMVYNVEKDITSQSGVATDVLKKVPMVAVDVDGNVDILGNSNILFLINGRPSSIFGNNLAEALQSIPASQIKSIEVITSPGAKYDAEGTGGIINIVLKENRLSGINGNLSLTGGSRLENGSLNLNARKGAFGLNAFFSGNAQLPSTTLNSSTRNSYDSSGNLDGQLLENGSGRFHRYGYESGLGGEWNINDRNVLSANVGYDHFANSNLVSYQQLSSSLDSSNAFVNQYSLVHSNSYFHLQSIDWNLRYKKTFAAEDQELDISVDGSEGSSTSSYMQTQSLPSGDSTYAGSQGSSSGHDRETNFRLDYVQPLGEKVKLETGGRIQIRDITSNSPYYSLTGPGGIYVYDSTQANSLTYDRRVYAGYASLSFPIYHLLDVKGGLRYERTETDAGFSKAPGTTIPGYNTFAPSIILSHSFGEGQMLKASYTRRIQRPDYRSLNPYVNASDPKNLTRGNPFLQPEVANNYDLTYTKSFNGGSALNVVLFYRHTSDDIQPFVTYYNSFPLGDTVYTDVSVSTQMNVGYEENMGVNVFGSVPLGKKLNIRTNLSLFHRYINTGTLGGENVSSLMYRINANASYQVSNTFILEFFGNFNSARNEVQGRYPSFTSYNFAARKQFWNKKASIAFTTTNPFGEYVNQRTVLSGTDFTLNSLRQIPFRSFGLNITYKFGKLEFKKDKEEPKDIPSTPENN